MVQFISLYQKIKAFGEFAKIETVLVLALGTHGLIKNNKQHKNAKRRVSHTNNKSETHLLGIFKRNVRRICIKNGYKQGFSFCKCTLVLLIKCITRFL